MLQLFGLSSSGANYHQYVAFTVRIPGLHGQHNASSSVISLMVPAGLYLYFQGRIRVLPLLGSFLAFLIALHLTSTRSPLIVSIVTVGFASLLARRFARSLVIGFLIVSMLIPLVVIYGPPGGWARWKNTEALVSNATERADSSLGAGQLILENPTGLGVRKGQMRLSEATGLGATHNAFLQAGLVFSLPFGILVLVGMIRGVVSGLGGISHPGFLASLFALQAAGLFMFEEHLNNPTFIILAMTFMALVSRSIRSEISPDDEWTDSPTRSPESVPPPVPEKPESP
jgi:hypothetical protein